MFVSYSVRCWQSPLPFEKGGIIVKRKLVAAVLLVLLVFGMTSVLADAGGWGEWIIDPRTGEEVFSFVPQDWGDGELGDESIPLYALCGLAAIAAVGAVVMHKKRQRVG